MSEEIVHLTAEEWMSLIDKTREEDGLGMCCANVSDLRDVIISIAHDGGQVFPMGHDLLWAYEHHLEGHPGLAEIPALRKLIDQARDVVGRKVVPGRCCGTCRHWAGSGSATEAMSQSETAVHNLLAGSDGCNLGRDDATITGFCFEYSRRES